MQAFVSADSCVNYSIALLIMNKSILLIACSLVVIGVQAQKKVKVVRPGQKISVVVTAKNTNYRLSKALQLQFTPFGQPYEHNTCVFVDTTKTFQSIAGIGGALTDASAETFAKLPAGKQDELIRVYFDKTKGIGYSLARTNMNSCDFSSDSYSYVEENDRELKSFSISHDEKFKIPLIKKAIEAAGGRLNLFISPWSPPGWMKNNKSMLQGGYLLKDYYQSWADYFVRFIRAYEAQGIPVWGLTVQNEPLAKQKWESCEYTAEEERDFIKNYLGPTLKNSGLQDKKLIAWDHNRDLMYHRASVILSDREASGYVWGIGFHWYESWKEGAVPENVKRVAEAFPHKALLLTEACNYPLQLGYFRSVAMG